MADRGSYLLLPPDELGSVPPSDDGRSSELFISRVLRTGLTTVADDPSRPNVPICYLCAQAAPIGAVSRLVLEEGTWRFAGRVGE